MARIQISNEASANSICQMEDLCDLPKERIFAPNADITPKSGVSQDQAAT